MSEKSGNWIDQVTGYTPKTTQTDHVTVQTGHDTTRPDNSTDIGKLFNRMNPPGVAGIATTYTGGKG